MERDKEELTQRECQPPTTIDTSIITMSTMEEATGDDDMRRPNNNNSRRMAAAPLLISGILFLIATAVNSTWVRTTPPIAIQKQHQRHMQSTGPFDDDGRAPSDTDAEKWHPDKSDLDCEQYFDEHNLTRL